MKLEDFLVKTYGYNPDVKNVLQTTPSNSTYPKTHTRKTENYSAIIATI